MNQPHQIAIVDDHPAMIAGLKQFFEGYPQLSISAELSSGQELTQFLRKNDADIVLLDVNIPEKDGLHCLEWIRKKGVDVKVVIYTTSNNRGVITSSLLAHTDAYVLKDDSTDELLQAVEAVANGETYFSAGIKDEVDVIRKELQVNDSLNLLSKREEEILNFLAKGFTVNETAKHLYISPLTAATHKKNILLKLGLSSTAELLHYASDTRRL